MSNFVNENLYERALEMLDYWEGTTIAKVLRQDIAQHDLGSLYEHVTLAERQANMVGGLLDVIT